VVSIRVEKSNLTGEKGVGWCRPKGLVYPLIGLSVDFQKMNISRDSGWKGANNLFSHPGKSDFLELNIEDKKSFP